MLVPGTNSRLELPISKVISCPFCPVFKAEQQALIIQNSIRNDLSENDNGDTQMLISFIIPIPHRFLQFLNNNGIIKTTTEHVPQQLISGARLSK